MAVTEGAFVSGSVGVAVVTVGLKVGVTVGEVLGSKVGISEIIVG